MASISKPGGPGNRKRHQPPLQAAPVAGASNRPLLVPASKLLTKEEAQVALREYTKAKSKQTMNDILDNGELQMDDNLVAYLEFAEAEKALADEINHRAQLEQNRKRLSRLMPDGKPPGDPRDAVVVPENWDDEPMFPEVELDVSPPFIRDLKHSPASVITTVVSECNRYIGHGEYTLVDVGATSASESRASKAIGLKYHGIAPGLFSTDVPLPDGRGCTHRFEDCDCDIQGRKVYLFNHSSYYMTTKALEKIELGSRVVVNEHDLLPSQSVLSGKSRGAWMTKRSAAGEYFTYDNRGVLKFQNAPSPLVPNWWILAREDKRPGSVVRVYDVGPKPPPPCPKLGCLDTVFAFFKSFIHEKTTEVLAKAEVEATPDKLHQRAQVLLMGVTTGGGVEEVTKSINRVARTLAHEEKISVVAATGIVRETHEQVMKAQDHLYNVAHKTMLRADYRTFVRLKPWIRVLIIALALSGIAASHFFLLGLTGVALASALGAVVMASVSSLATELTQRYEVFKRTSA